ELAGRPATTLRVAASDYLGKGLLAPVLRDLLDEDPPVRFELVTTHSRAGVRLLVDGDVDLAVVTGQETPRGLEERHLFDQPFVWVGPRRGRDRTPLTERLRRAPAVVSLGAEADRIGRAQKQAIACRSKLSVCSRLKLCRWPANWAFPGRRAGAFWSAWRSATSSIITETQYGGVHGTADQQRSTQFHRRDHPGEDQLPRLDR